MKIVSITLEEVANQFKSWRQDKSNKFEPIPSHLKNLVKNLLPYYPRKEIIRHLNITSPTISSIQKQIAPFTNHSTKCNQQQNVNFIPFHVTSASAVSAGLDAIPVTDDNTSRLTKQDNITCQIIKPNGTKLVIQTSDTRAIIQAFLCCN